MLFVEQLVTMKKWRLKHVYFTYLDPPRHYMQLVANTVGICDILFDDHQMHFRHILSERIETYDHFTIIKSPTIKNYINYLDNDNLILTIFFFIIALIVLFIIYSIYKQFKRNRMEDDGFLVARIITV